MPQKNNIFLLLTITSGGRVVGGATAAAALRNLSFCVPEIRKLSALYGPEKVDGIVCTRCEEFEKVVIDVHRMWDENQWLHKMHTKSQRNFRDAYSIYTIICRMQNEWVSLVS